jgi:superoxide reductase
MSAKQSVYKCESCGNVIEELWNGATEPQCCGKAMSSLVPNTVDAAKEKHVPVIERAGNRVTVRVGSVAHPMTPQHYILFVELVTGRNVYRRDLKEGDPVAEAVFLVDEKETDLVAREYCNLHGFWSTK